MLYVVKLLIFVIISILLEQAYGDICYNDDDLLYCDDCCGDYGYQWCCDYYWSTGSIAGTAVGIFFLIFITVLVVLCCRRRRLYGTYWGRPSTVMTVVNPTATVSTVSTTSTAYPSQPPPYPGNQYPARY